MQRAMWSAASGMAAQQTQVDVIANNLANVNTNGFKRSRAEFADLFYQSVHAPGSNVTANTRRPTGIQIGLGSKAGGIKKVFEQGNARQTGNDLDMMIQGAGFFRIQLEDGTFAYTRDGSFTKSDTGDMVTATGALLDPGINIPDGVTTIEIGRDGTVSTFDGTNGEQLVGEITIVNFINPAGLRSLGDNMYAETAASGVPTEGTPGQDGLGSLLGQAVEVSNVSIVTELVDLISAQRAYELNSRAIQTSDEMLQEVNNLVR